MPAIPNHERLIVVMGMARSGTTIFTYVLCRHPQIALFRDGTEAWLLENDCLPRWQTDRIGRVTCLFPEAKYVVLKRPWQEEHVEWLHEHLPRARFIVLVRDREAIQQSWATTGRWALAGRPQALNEPDACYDAYFERALRLADVLGEERCRTVRYERMVEAPNAVFGELADWLGVERRFDVAPIGAGLHWQREWAEEFPHGDALLEPGAANQRRDSKGGQQQPLASESPPDVARAMERYLVREKVSVTMTKQRAGVMPIYINNFNWLTSTRRLAAFFDDVPNTTVVIVDNASGYGPLLEWYERDCPYEVVRLKDNIGCHAPWHCGAILPPEEHRRRFGGDYYVLTDADLSLDGVPKDLLDVFVEAFDRYPDVTKVGPGLEIDDLPANSPVMREVVAWEGQFWRHRRDERFYNAAIDTTFGVYRTGVPCKGVCLRGDRPYVARHLPWYITPKTLTDEQRFYVRSAVGGCWSNKLKALLDGQ